MLTRLRNFIVVNIKDNLFVTYYFHFVTIRVTGENGET